MRLPALRKAGKAYAIRPVVGYSYTGFLGKQKSVGDEKAHLKDFLKSIFFAWLKYIDGNVRSMISLRV